MGKIVDGRFPLASQSESLPWVNTETTFCKYGRFYGPSRSRKIQELVYDTWGKNRINVLAQRLFENLGLWGHPFPWSSLNRIITQSS